MRVAVLGLGHVGSVAAGCLASRGHEVLGIDSSEEKVGAINSGRLPIVEPHLEKLIAASRANGRLEATSVVDDRLDACDIALVCVGTPGGADGGHDLQQVTSATRSIASAISTSSASRLTVAYRSTVRPGTCENVIAPLFRAQLGEAANDLVEIVHHPEFLREAQAVDDFFNPPRLVFGTMDGAPSQRMTELYQGFDAPIFHVGIREAEMTKFIDNSWHATKVAFANEFGRMCAELGVSASEVHAMFVADTKLNLGDAYLRPGGPFGGSCLPKDVRALQQIGANSRSIFPLLDSLLQSNMAHKRHQLDRAVAGLRPGAKILLVGLAFKHGTDDLRESPNVELAASLVGRGYDVSIYDPDIRPDRILGQNLSYITKQLSQFGELMIGRGEAESGQFDRILATSRLIDDLSVEPDAVVDLCTIP